MNVFHSNLKPIKAPSFTNLYFIVKIERQILIHYTVASGEKCCRTMRGCPLAAYENQTAIKGEEN